jgi:hypothetical protein
MLVNEFPIMLDNTMTRTGCVLMLLGAIGIQFVGWSILGWALLTYGLMALWLAHLFAIAPLCIEPESIDIRADC